MFANDNHMPWSHFRCPNSCASTACPNNHRPGSNLLSVSDFTSVSHSSSRRTVHYIWDESIYCKASPTLRKYPTEFTCRTSTRPCGRNWRATTHKFQRGGTQIFWLQVVTCSSSGDRSSTKLVWTTTNGFRPDTAKVYALGTGFCRTYRSGGSRSSIFEAFSIKLCRSASWQATRRQIRYPVSHKSLAGWGKDLSQ